MIPYVDYGSGVKYSILDNNIACARWIREEWHSIRDAACQRSKSRCISTSRPAAAYVLHTARNPAAMNFAMRFLTAAKSSDLHSPPDSLSTRPVRASVSSSAPLTK